MLAITLGAIDGNLLARVCAEQWPESQTLEFKRAAPSPDDRGVHEFLKDVCGLANADGGDIAYGIVEENARAVGLLPIDQPADALKRRLGQILDARVEPRLVGAVMHEVPVDDGSVLVLRVPASFNGPHRFTQNNHSKFVARSGTHTSEMSYEQLRMAFDRTATLGERSRQFRQGRIDTIVAGKTWRPMRPGPTCIVHLIPLTAMAGRQSVNIPTLYNAYTQFMFAGWGGASRDTNLDGLVVHPGARDAEGLLAYSLVFRIGVFEALRHGGALAINDRIIPSTAVSSFFREALGRFTSGCRDLGIVGPAIAGIAFLGVSGYRFALDQRWLRWEEATSDRDHLVLPELWIDSLEDVADVDSVARPMLDVLWQCFGIERCLEYDPDGRWIR